MLIKCDNNAVFFDLAGWMTMEDHPGAFFRLTMLEVCALTRFTLFV